MFPLLAQAAQQASQAANTGGGDGWLVWAVVLVGIAVVLFIVELFLPSGGLIGFLSAASLIAGIVLLFRVDTTLGLLGAAAAVVALPFAVMGALAVWPNTPIAQWITHKDEPRPSRDGAAAAALAAEVGQRGRAITDLRPVGVCVLDGRRTECLAQGGMIEAGREVEVVAVDGMQVRVRAVG